jgi:hypothetical protein
MASSSFIGNLGAPAPPVQGQPVKLTKPPIKKAPAGSLFIRDTFMPSVTGMYEMPRMPHGMLVYEASKQQSHFDGPVIPSVRDEPQSSANNPAADPHRKKLADKKLTKEEALKELSASTERQVTTFLDDQSDYLERVTKTGTKNSAVNFSLGGSKAAQALQLYNDVLSAVTAPKDQQGGAAAERLRELTGGGGHTAENYIKAFDIDVDKLKSKDPKVRGAEEKRLQQAIIDHTSKSIDGSKKIDKSIDRWDDAVEAFEGNNNSVVISAGNEGDIEETLEKWNGNNQLKLPKDFETNFLENDLVTSVGATLPDKKGQQKRAEWSSESGGVDIYADGTVRDAGSPDGKAQGTSFASPKVAATMAELHQKFPNLTSAQIETLMRSQLTKPVRHGSGTVPVLDLSADLTAVRNKKF